MQEKIHVLNKAVEDGQLFDQSNRDLTSEMEQVIEDLKSKEFDLKQAVEEKEAASQKILELANEVRSITQERDSLQQLKENLEEEVHFVMCIGIKGKNLFAESCVHHYREHHILSVFLTKQTVRKRCPRTASTLVLGHTGLALARYF